MIYFQVRTRGPVPGVMKRELNKIFKFAYLRCGLRWHRKFRPKHFTEAGAREYRYKPRKGEKLRRDSKRFRRSYTGRKLRKWGHTLPLVWSGTSRQRSRIPRIKATSKGVRVIINAPALNFRPKGGRIDMRSEMTHVSARERDELVRLFDKTVDQKLKQIRRTTRKRI